MNGDGGIDSTFNVSADGTIDALLVQADGGIEYGSDAPAEKRPSYWVGRLEGALGALVSAVEDAQRE